MSVTNKEIVDSAMEYKGKLSYQFGGNDIPGGKGDCSDFTEYIYSLFGINIGAETGAQYEKGYSVDRDEAQAGDLVFFKNTYNSGKKDGVSHVGIMINSSQFINLNNDGCKVDSLNSDYWDSHFLDVRRLREVEYSDYSVSEGSEETSEEDSDIGLTWWGDIVKVVVIVIVLIGGVALLASSFGMEVMKGKGVLTDGN